MSLDTSSEVFTILEGFFIPLQLTTCIPKAHALFVEPCSFLGRGIAMREGQTFEVDGKVWKWMIVSDALSNESLLDMGGDV